ncbi:MAG: sigma-70 family RNA polymerase sigma factor [Phycisphaerae bacterium]|nr:sigma-70 family RNA polymerase sigma factor [Phycisphaerae bacterium]
MTHPEDPTLIDACLRGDRGAWDSLVERYARLVWSIPRKYGLAEADAEDVHQAVFATLVHHLGGLRDRDRLSSWLITTATRECWRLRKRQTRGPAAFGEGDDPATPTDIRPHEDEQLVREAMARISERCRDLLTALFRAVGEPHYPEIAQQLGMPVGSIGPTRARCLSRLESLLRERGLGSS